MLFPLPLYILFTEKRIRREGTYMEYNVAVAAMQQGQQIEGYYVIDNIQIKTSVSGSTYVSAKVSDASGSVDAKLWNFNGGIVETDSGKVVKLRGEVTEFKGNPQFNIQRIRLANEHDEYNLKELVPSAPLYEESAVQEILQLISTMQDEDYRGISEALLRKHMDTFRVIPAAKSVHHAFLNGLLMHTLNMLRTADFFAELYAEVIDRDLLLAGTLLHDFGKLREFTCSQLGLVTDYSVEGKLLGHLYMGAQEVAALASEREMPAEKSMLLQHLILSHHGQPEFGAVVPPQCAESELLSYIDMVDSRMEIYAETLSMTPEGRFSNKVFALDKAVFRHPMGNQNGENGNGYPG